MIQWLNDKNCCTKCGLLRPCNPCPGRKQAFTYAWSATAYAGPAADLLRALKFYRAQTLAELIGTLMAAQIPTQFQEHSYAAVVPVPPRLFTTIQRGFDPVKLIAQSFAKQQNIPILRPLRWRYPLHHQTGKQRSTRTTSKSLQVMCKQHIHPLPKALLLLDDVHTTGTTLSVCAKALKEHGVQKVAAISWARTL